MTDLSADLFGPDTSAISNAILGQESGNSANAGTSIDGAVGRAQIEPATFAQYAQPGESIDNDEDNIAVHKRIIDDLNKRANGDPARVAVGYFSGPGNIAPPDSPTPWKADHKDGNGKSVSSYVTDVMGRLNPISDAEAAQPVAEKPVAKDLSSDLFGDGPSFLDQATQPFKDIVPDILAEYKSGTQAMTQPLPQPSGHVGQDLLNGEKDVFGRALGTAQAAFSPLTGSIKALTGTPAYKTAVANGISPQDAKDYVQNPIEIAANIATPLGIEKYAPELAAGAGNILDKLKNSSFIQDEASQSGPFASASKAAAARMAPSIDPRIAEIVKDAENLGINIPPRVFNPGSTSNFLNKAGLMSDGTMKSDVTNALSKVMGHPGTPNLDMPTMEGIQNTIGGKMNDFALKADSVGGIPVLESDLDTIANDSFADDPKVQKLAQKIKDRIQNGAMSGKDYQELTKKNGALSKAMNSADSDFADTAKEFREHLEQSLQNVVHPDDLAAFKEARRQYRTMKIIQPLVESGGVTGQADSAAKLFNAVNKNYGGMQNAVNYNPELGKIAQIVNEFPEALKDAPVTSLATKLSKAATVPAALGVGAVGYVPAAVTMGTAVPAAKGVATYMSSPFYKNAILKNSGYAKGGIVEKRKEKIYYKHSNSLREKLGRTPKSEEIELAQYIGAHGVKRLLSQKDLEMPAYKMFPKETVEKNKQLFFSNKKPYKVKHIQEIL